MELLEKLSISTKTTGFSSPARDYVDKRLDLNDLLIQNIYSTFYFRWDGENVLGLERGDYLLVDRAVNPSDDSLVIYTKGDDLGVDKFSNVNPTKLWGTILWKITRIEK